MSSWAKSSRAEFERVAAEYGYSKMEDLYAALGYGKFSARQVLSKAAPGQVKEEPPRPAPETAAPRYHAAGSPHDGDAVIKVRGVDDLLVYRAKCCNPIRGEAIVGYVTRGKGVAVHSKICPNVQSLLYDVERKIEVEWARAAEDAFPVRIVIHTDDRPGMLNQLTSVLSNENTNIRSLEAKTDMDQDGGVVEMTVDVRDKKQLEKLVSAMRRISGVRDVERLSTDNVFFNRPRTHRHLQIQRHQDRLEGRPSQRIRPGVSPRQVPLRQLHRSARHPAAPARIGQPFPNVQARAQNARRGAGGQLCHPNQLERRPQRRHLLLRTFPPHLPLRRMPVDL